MMTMMYNMCITVSLLVLLASSTLEGKDLSTRRDKRAVNTDEQAKMVTNDGHLTFQTGTNHNITFKTGGGTGRIVIDTFDLVEMARMVKANKDTTAALQASVDQLRQDVEDVKSRVQSLEQNEVTIPPGLQNQVVDLQNRMQLLSNDLSNNECSSNPCRNGGTCVNLYQGFQCRCTPGYQGTTCNDDVNECAVISGTEDECQNGGTCVNNRGSYTCRCTANWYGTKCSIQFDDCSTASATELCGHGYCVDISRTVVGQSKYQCICFDGWQKDSSSSNSPCAVDVDECEAREYPCSSAPRVDCINVPGTYYCGNCPAGYTGNGNTCSDIDECQSNNGGCSVAPLVQCINTIGSRTCGTCPAGYVGNGAVCTYIGICNQNNGGCSPLAICTESSGVPEGRVCTCPPGNSGNGIGPNGCSSTSGGGGNTGGGGGGATTCNDNPCVHGRCRSTGTTAYECECDSGYEGANCDRDINECASNPCQNSGTCVDADSGYTCSCTSGFGGVNCQETLYECGAWLSGSSGEFEFPREGHSYPHGVSCAWVISIPDSSEVIRIEFPRFDLEASANCNFDFLQINDGNTAATHPLGRFCNSDHPPASLTSTHDQLYFWFKSDFSVSHGGFKVSWTSVEPVCGGEVTGANHGAINSPGYPGVYPNNRDCVWRVTVDAGRFISIAFSTLQLEHHETCDYDYLEVHDGLEEDSPSLGKFCHTVLPAPVQTSGPYVTIRFHSDGSEQDAGFHITYTSFTTDPGCGGVLTDDLAILISPNYPNTYPHNAECIWTIQVPEGNTIEYIVTDLTIEEHTNCQYDYVELRDGFDETAPFVGRYCHADAVPPAFTSSGNTLWVKFKSDGSIAYAGGFRATYAVACGGIYTEPTGEITSPYFPDPYPHNRECEYIITAEQGLAVQLTFLTFDVEGHDECAFDFLEVRNGGSADSDVLATLCGSAPPAPITGTSNSMYLKFSTDGSVANHGFRASYVFVEGSPGCGGLFTDVADVLSSPSHPDTYPHGVHCVYTIQVDPGYVVRLIFASFSLESHPNCNYDYVAVYDNTTTSGDGDLGRYCGSTPPQIITSEGNIMTVVFHTDSSVSMEGFTATYVSVDASTVCGGSVLSNSGVVTSPNYPGNYPHNKECVWTIEADPGIVIEVDFTNFHLEGGSCNYDYVELRNGGYSNSPLIGQFCGTSIVPSSFTSHSHKLYVKFKTDSSVSFSGFSFNFDATTAGCGGTISSPSGSILSPNYPYPYHHNAECFWLIDMSEGSLIIVSFADLDLEGHSSCIFDYVKVFDGAQETDPVLGTFCGTELPAPVYSTGSQVRIKMRTDYSVSGAGFHASYVSNCNGVRLTKRSGFIESPNFPDPYPHSRDCLWIIEADAGNRINITFNSLVLEYHGSCDYDYIRIYDGESTTAPLLDTLCGTPNTAGIAYGSTDNLMAIAFHTDSSVADAGFSASYVSYGCGADLTTDNGQLMSPGFPNLYPHARECTWSIVVSIGHAIKLSIWDFDVESHSTCDFDALEVYSGYDDDGLRLTQICHTQTTAMNVSTTGNVMFVRFRTDASVSGRGFNATYQSIDGGCGGDFSTPTGDFHSHNYPSRYDHHTDCTWSVTVEDRKRVNLTFLDFQLEGGSCVYDYVTVYDGPSATYPLLMRHCGIGLPDPVFYLSTSNRMFIRMRADGSISRTGFHATYEAVCGGRLDAAVGGVITSENYPDKYSYNQNCTWIIESANPLDRVTLMFTYMDIELSDDCANDAVIVRNGNDELAPQVGRFCGHSVPAAMTSFGAAFTVSFVSNGDVRGVGFRATYTTAVSACGGVYTSLAGAFASPGYPDSYPTNTDCVWTIPSSPGNRVQVTFTTFALQDTPGCGADYLEMRSGDENGDLIGRFCGDNIPSNATSYGTMWIRFFSDNATIGSGFTAQYGNAYGGVLTPSIAQVASPNYPNRYTDHLYVTWTLQSSGTNRIRVTFTDFQLESPHHFTCFDYVSFMDGPSVPAPEIGRVCGTDLPAPIESTGSAMTVLFYTDYSVTNTGFLFQWAEIGGTTEAVCPEGWFYHGSSCYKRINIEYEYQDAQNACEQEDALSYVAVVNDAAENAFVDGVVHGDHIWLGCTAFGGNHLWTCPDGSGKTYDTYTRTASPADSYWNWAPSQPQINEEQCQVQYGEIGEWHDYPCSSTFRVVCEVAVSDCGSTLLASDTRANFSSQGYPVSYPNAHDCSWTIESDVGTTIMLNITNIGTEYQLSCLYDYIKVYDGFTSDNREIGTYCGRVLPGPVYSSSNALYVAFHSDASVSDTGFAATYKTYCGGSYTAHHGVITSPLYPSNYPANQNCTWTIQVLPGFTIQVNFQRLDIQTSSSCSNDYIELKNGLDASSPPLGNGKYCGSSRPGSLETSSNNLRLQFVSDGSGARAGFQLSYLAVQEGCGGQLVLTDADVGSSGYELQSQNYPQNYEHNVECIWIISAPATEAIQVDFQDPFYIEHTSSCAFDYLDVRDGASENSALLGRLCGSTLPNTIVSSSNALFVKFRTDSSSAHAGFKFKYGIATCGGTYSGTDGEITSPNFPATYDNDLDCKWYLQGPTGHYMTFTFPDFDVVASQQGNCSLGDFLQIYDGRNESATSLGQFCGSTAPSSVDTSDSLAYIRFRSDSAGGANGFRIQYTTSVEVCGGDLVTPRGTFTSPNYPGEYAHARQCEWSITVAEGHLVTLRFDAFDLEFDNSCDYDRLEVYNGLESDSPRIATLCGTNPPNEIQSSGNTMRVVFISDGSITGAGFVADYDSQDSALCGGRKTVSPGAAASYIFSPGYGISNYSANVQCEWVIESTATTNSSMYLDWDDGFNMEGPEQNCLFDYVEIRAGSDMSGQLIGRYCGSTKPDPISVPLRSIFVQFVTDSSSHRAGFKLSYSASNCGGLVSGTNGVITSPNYPANYESTNHCAWMIIAPEGTTITLTFTDFGIETHSVCGYDRLYALNGGSLNSPQISGENPWCGQTAPDPITSASNKVILIFQTDSSVTSQGFRLEWSSDQRGCGGNFHGNQGSISSTNYPSVYDANSECVWTITVETGYHVVLTFDSTFNVRSGDAVRVYDGNSDSSPVLGTYSGNTAPATLSSSLKTMRVRFQSDASNQGTGFQATWNIGCGSVFNNVSVGRIVSPGYPNRQYPNTFTCEYVINWFAGRMLALRFDDNFDIEESSNCGYDGLDIYTGVDNTGILLGRFCGSTSPGVLSTDTSVYLYFHTDSSRQGDGFGLTFEEGCGGVFTTPSGIIQTPAHLESYRHNQNCTWVITVSADRSIQLKFSSLDVEYGGTSCLYDFVEVLDGDSFGAPSRSGRLCGTDAPEQTIISSGRSLFVNFVTDRSGSGLGFQAAYQAIIGPGQGCGGYIQQSSGSISSLDLNNDGSYDDNLHCSWYISVEANKIVRLDFNTEFNIENSGDCTRDYLEIRDGYGELAPLVGRFCGATAPSSITLSSNQAYVLFHSDESTGGTGFTIDYSASDLLCGGTFNATDTPQVITSLNYPGTYTANQRCSWVISSPDDYTHVRIAVTALDIEDHSNCINDYLELKDYPLSAGGQSLRYCGSTVPATFDSSTHAVQIYFRTDDSSQGTGFSLQYYIADCNHNYTADNGRVRSPGQTEHYHNGHECQTSIITPNNTFVSLYFNNFAVEYAENCQYDYLQVYNGSDDTAPQAAPRLCGNGLPNPIFATGNQLYLKFYTDSSVTDNGYDITYTSSSSRGCGGNLTGREGSFTSPMYPYEYPINQNCEWRIEVPSGGQHVSLEFSYINVDGQEGICNDDRVEVYDGQSSSGRLFGNYCGTTPPAVITATGVGRFMFIRFISDGVTSTGNNTYTGFRAKFTS